jgi:two-component system chemotaxis sensor kinase CheA
MEDVLNKARKSELTIDSTVMDVILKSVDMMKALLESIKDSGSDLCDIDIEDMCKKLDSVLDEGGSDLATKEVEDIKVEAPKLEDSIDDHIDPHDLSDEEVEAEIERLLAEKMKEKEAKKALKVKQPQKVEDKSVNSKDDNPTKKVEKKATAPEQTIRVEVNRLDNLMNLIGELVLGKNRLLKIYDDVEERYEGEKFLEELNQVVSSVSMVTTDLQIAVMKTRMLPVSKVFNKFPRLVRDLSRELDKDIELIMMGEDTELDKSIVEVIGDPLVHMIRNSCDHGIESREDRKLANKSNRGYIELKAYNEGNQIVIEIKDDGAGMDADFLKMKALDKGIVSEKDISNMSDKEAYGLIFKPGFSTAAKVTGVSGRGVGMDVVKTNIEKLNGVIDIDSTLGVGSVFKLKIPLTLAIMQALLVAAQEEYFAIPLSSVLETVRINMDEIYTIDGKNVLKLRDEILSLVRLSDMYGVQNVLESDNQVYVVVIGIAESKLGLIVDGLVGQEEVVIKSMGDYLQGIEGIAGATIRGDGGVTLITDVSAMIDLARSIDVDLTAIQGGSVEEVEKNSPSDYNVLIVDDSYTDRNIMKKGLNPLGINIIEATNGVEALEVLKQGDRVFDAILIDIEMPQMDGYTLASEIRKYSRYKNLPLIAVTSRSSKSDRLRGVEVGMTEYITKPYSLKYLADTVSRNINLELAGV